VRRSETVCTTMVRKRAPQLGSPGFRTSGHTSTGHFPEGQADHNHRTLHPIIIVIIIQAHIHSFTAIRIINLAAGRRWPLWCWCSSGRTTPDLSPLPDAPLICHPLPCRYRSPCTHLSEVSRDYAKFAMAELYVSEVVDDETQASTSVQAKVCIRASSFSRSSSAGQTHFIRSF